MSQSSTHMLCSTFVSAKIRHGNLKTSVFNFCGSMLPGFADFNAKNNKKNLHDCNEYMNNDELRNTLKFSQLSRYTTGMEAIYVITHETAWNEAGSWSFDINGTIYQYENSDIA